MDGILLKYAFIGDSGVGKSTLLHRLKYGEYKTFGPTIGVDHIYYPLVINNKPVKIHIWDTAGQERFKSISSHFYKNTNALFIIFDITNANSFKNVDYWIKEAKKNADEIVQFVLIGTKSDLNDIRAISKEDVEKYAELNNIKYYETNAKSDFIQYVITEVTALIVKKTCTQNSVETIIIKDDNNKVQDSRKFCC